MIAIGVIIFLVLISLMFWYRLQAVTHKYEARRQKNIADAEKAQNDSRQNLDQDLQALQHKHRQEAIDEDFTTRNDLNHPW